MDLQPFLNLKYQIIKYQSYNCFKKVLFFKLHYNLLENTWYYSFL